jgi:hypothetical protein
MTRFTLFRRIEIATITRSGLAHNAFHVRAIVGHVFGGSYSVVSTVTFCRN